MAKAKQKVEAPQEMRIIFKDRVAKDLMGVVLNDYGSSIEALMSQIAPALGYGAVDPVIEVRNDEVVVESTATDKGIVITGIGYQKYPDVREGQKYCAIKDGKFGLFIKSGEKDGVKQADVLKGYAPTINEAYIDMNEKELDVEKL